MKIEAVKCFHVAGEKKSYFIVKVETDTGIYGLGEAGICRWSGAITSAVEHLSELVVGQDPFATERLWQIMYRASFFPADKVYTAAISAIDIALWDIKGKALDMPVYRLLGGPVRDKVPCYIHSQSHNMDGLVTNCRRLMSEGWQYLRWHLPVVENRNEDWDTGNVIDPNIAVEVSVDQMRTLREALGGDVQICFDVHTRLDMAKSVELCRRLEPFRPYFVEDPLRSENPGSYRTLARQVGVPIAAGEQWAGKWSFREVIEEELIQYARIDLCIAGGLTEALKITHWCETHYIDIVPHNPLGPVSAAAGVALCMASSNVGVQEMTRKPGSTDADLFPQQVRSDGGFARPQEVPGLGVDFDEELATKRLAKKSGFDPILRKPDGSFTNY